MTITVWIAECAISLEAMKFVEYIQNCLALLNRNEVKRYLLLLALMSLINILDLITVFGFAYFSLALTKQSDSIPNLPIVGDFISRTIDMLTTSEFLVVLGISLGCVLILRTLFALIVNRSTTSLLSQSAARLSSQVLGRAAQGNALLINRRSIGEYIWLFSEGAYIPIVLTLGALSTIVSEILLLIILSLGLLFIEPWIWLALVLYFSLLMIFIWYRLIPNIKETHSKRADFAVQLNSIITERIDSFREIKTLNLYSRFDEIYNSLKFQDSKELTKVNILSSLPRHLMELAFFLGVILVGVIAVLGSGSQEINFTIGLFLAAGVRVLPSIIRLQVSLHAIEGAHASSKKMFQFLDEIKDETLDEAVGDARNNLIKHKDLFVPSILLENVSFHYPHSSNLVIDRFSIMVESGEKIGITGPSGGGKSTLLDLILGFLDPVGGQIKISGVAPRMAFDLWPYKIAYISQNPSLTSGTLFSNVTFAQNPSEADEGKVLEVLSQVGLSDFALNLPEGLHSRVGERGSALSGGQRQRLALARALYFEPKILVLDEATSALDAESEQQIADFLKASSATVVLVSHSDLLLTCCHNVIYVGNRL